MPLHVDIVSAEREIFTGLVEVVFAPGILGELGIYPKHAPLLTQLKPGEVRVLDVNVQDLSFFISGGVIEVQPHIVTILADTAVRAEDLDEAAAIEAKQRAEKTMADKKSDIDFATAKAELAELAAIVETIKKIRSRKR